MNALDLLASYVTLSSEFFLIQYLLLSSCITLDLYTFSMLLACYVKIIINKCMKYYANLYLPPEISDRPFDATSTNILDSNLLSLVHTRPGFPSGHTMCVAFFSTVMMFHFVNCTFTWIVIAFSIATGWSRYYKKAHTLLQILVGYGVGILYGIGVHYLFNYLDLDSSRFWGSLLIVPKIKDRRIISDQSLLP